MSSRVLDKTLGEIDTPWDSAGHICPYIMYRVSREQKGGLVIDRDFFRLLEYLQRAKEEVHTFLPKECEPRYEHVKRFH